MACFTVTKPNQTLAQRNAEVASALQRLRRYIAAGQVKIVLAPNGAVGLSGWKDRDDVTDVCAIRTLSAEGSWELRQAIARAEAMTGRKANLQATSAGFHTHDGGRTWHGGH